jgi:hypothetical protein
MQLLCPAPGTLSSCRIVRRSHASRGKLPWPASLLQLAVFAAFFGMPYVYMPPEWAWDWLPNGTWNRIVALTVAAS